MIVRAATSRLQDRLKNSPAAVLIGPRQAGKTTLARSLAGGRYYDLEQETDRLRLDLEWEDVVRSRKLVVLDEAQAWPEVFPRLRGAIDGDRKRNARFLLLGSVAPALMTEVSESLAGRLAIVELGPLYLKELDNRAQRDRHWLVGGFPDGGVLRPRAYPDWQLDYLTLLTQRDLPAWGLPANPTTTRRLLRMVAAVHGQTWNASAIGRSLGVSYHTVNAYLDYLEGAFLLRRLPPYSANVRKRLVKSPKVFVRDSGLLHALLGGPDQDTLLDQPWVGASWEGYVVEQILGHLTARGIPHDAFHFRTNHGQEIDLVLELAGHTWAIEARLTTSPSPQALRRLDAVADLIQADRRFLVTRVTKPIAQEDRGLHSLPSFLDRLAAE